MKLLLVFAAVLSSAISGMASAAGGVCNAAPTQIFIGTIGTADVGRVAKKRAGAKTIRWIQPDAMVTMDYRAERLNVRLDKRNFVIALDCG